MKTKDVVEIKNKNFKDSLALNLFGKDYDLMGCSFVGNYR